jgi:hypothetical protein
MKPLILRAKDVQLVLNLCRTDSYRVIKEIKDEYPYSKKLIGSKVRMEDLAQAYNLNVEHIGDFLSQEQKVV